LAKHLPILAVDAGNSRIKWALHDGRAFLRDGWRALTERDALARDWSALPLPGCIIAANVAGDGAQAALEQAAAALGRDVRFLIAQPRQCGVINRYDNVAQLGPDRWAALVAAYALGPAPRLVVCAGTAVTVDALLADGVFLGGIIVPGIDLMRASLVAATARLGNDVGEVQDFPRATKDAIASGAIQAICGAVQRQRDALAAQAGTQPHVVLSGGGAQMIARHLGMPLEIRERLVLEGLVRIAGELQ
jgi:type III pantothenate kinase